MNCPQNNADRPWLVAIDTGGTFTDAVARSPSGRQSQVKVFSNGALRARILEREADDGFRLDFHGLTVPEDLLLGFTIRTLVDDAIPTVIASDGDLQEGVSQEAISIAGHLKLSKLVVLWDDNSIQIDGDTALIRTPCSAASNAAQRVSAITPALAAA